MDNLVQVEGLKDTFPYLDNITVAGHTQEEHDRNVKRVVECDPSDIAISATINQKSRPVAFMSKTLHGNELHYPAVEKEATAIIDAVRKWTYFLSRQHFTLVTDQRSVSFMLDNRKRTKIKNNKIQSWRLKLAHYSCNIFFIVLEKKMLPRTHLQEDSAVRRRSPV